MTDRIIANGSTIRQWVAATFAGPEAKLFFELGAHDGSDTHWMAQIPNVRIVPFEPDPRNITKFIRRGLERVIPVFAAISDHDGEAQFIPSVEGWGRPWTDSGSLRRPKFHLQQFPSVKFGAPFTVSTLSLDTAWERFSNDVQTAMTAKRLYHSGPPPKPIDFIWCDVQGSEVDVIRGGQTALKNTRYFYTEYSNRELYEGQATLEQLLQMLPAYRIVKQWPTDVLLENTQFQERDI